VVGAGFIGRVHLNAVRAVGGVVVGVADPHPGRAAAIQAMAMAERAAGPVDELIEAPDVEVVHICTPNESHFDLAQRALRAGKHVVCEKPLTTSLTQSARLTRLAAETGVLTAVPFVYRYYPMVREMRERVRRGEAGRLSMVHGSYLQDWLAYETDINWRLDPARGGPSRAFGDIGVHWVDLVEFTSGQRLTRLSAQFVTAYPERIGPDGRFEVTTEDAATVSFETEGGALGAVVLSQVSHGRKNRIHFSLDGTKASFVFDHEQPDVLWVGARSANRVLSRDPDHLSDAAARYVTLPAGHPQGYQDCFNAFVRDFYSAVRGEAPDGLPCFADGLRAAAVTEAVLTSAATGTWVEVPPPGPSRPGRNAPGAPEPLQQGG
jgi:predicted dehydrogenase